MEEIMAAEEYKGKIWTDSIRLTNTLQGTQPP